MLIAASVGFAVGLVVGFLIGRYVATLLPILGFALHYAGLSQGWWGSGLGEAWQWAFAMLLLPSAAGVVAGVTLRRAVRRSA